MSLKGKPSSPSAPAPLLKNAATAPLVFFDCVPTHGVFEGSIALELATRVVLPKPDGDTMIDMMCTGHLRCSPIGAMMLRDALTAALEMLERLQKQAAENAATQHLN